METSPSFIVGCLHNESELPRPMRIWIECRDIEQSLSMVIPKKSDSGIEGITAKQMSVFTRSANVSFKAYGVISPVLFILAVLGLLLALVFLVIGLVRKVYDLRFKLSVFALSVFVACGASVFTLILAVAWQYPFQAEISAADMYQHKYYTATVVPLMQIIEIVATMCLVYYIGQWVKAALKKRAEALPEK